MIWLIFILMCAGGAVAAVLPLLRGPAPRTTPAVLVGLTVSGLAIATYSQIGSPGLSPEEPDTPHIGQMVESLAARLEDDPGDLDGWVMLGRSYMAFGDLPAAVAAFNRAVELESGRNAETLMYLGEAMFSLNNEMLDDRTIELFEQALLFDAAHPAALYWNGIKAAMLGDTAAAISHWETLLAQKPGEDISQHLRQGIARWGGTPVADAGRDQPGFIKARVALSMDISPGVPPSTTVFIIARDPGHPGPPIAVARRQLADLPVVVHLSDSDAMTPGRVLSSFDEVELVARLSVSGQPAAEPGDWFAEAVARPGEEREIFLTIGRQVGAD